MAELPAPLDLSSVPTELILAVAREAERDAEMVGHFLDALSETPAGSWLTDRPAHLPAHFLLGLGGAMRLLLWEQKGIRIHQVTGLPSAREALLDVFRAVSDPEARARACQLAPRIVALFIQHFAWAGRIELDADVLLDPVDEDMALEALADFLWDQRHLGQRQENP
jgi:hypothetical protein